MTSTPYDPARAAGDGLAGALGAGELVRDELAAGEGGFAVPVPGRLQAPSTNGRSVPSAAARRYVFTPIKGNDTLRFGLRFRYDPAPEAGHRPSPPGHPSNGPRFCRPPSRRPVLFYLAPL